MMQDGVLGLAWVRYLDGTVARHCAGVRRNTGCGVYLCVWPPGVPCLPVEPVFPYPSYPPGARWFQLFSPHPTRLHRSGGSGACCSKQSLCRGFQHRPLESPKAKAMHIYNCKTLKINTKKTKSSKMKWSLRSAKTGLRPESEDTLGRHEWISLSDLAVRRQLLVPTKEVETAQDRSATMRKPHECRQAQDPTTIESKGSRAGVMSSWHSLLVHRWRQSDRSTVRW